MNMTTLLLTSEAARMLERVDDAVVILSLRDFEDLHGRVFVAPESEA